MEWWRDEQTSIEPIAFMVIFILAAYSEIPLLIAMSSICIQIDCCLVKINKALFNDLVLLHSRIMMKT